MLSSTISAQSLNPFEPENAAKDREWQTALVDSIKHTPDSLRDNLMQQHLQSFRDLDNNEILGEYYQIWGNALAKANPTRAADILDQGIKSLEGKDEKLALTTLYMGRIPLYHPQEAEDVKKCLDRVNELTKDLDNHLVKLNMHQLYTAYYAKQNNVQMQFWHARNAVRFAAKTNNPNYIAGPLINLARCHKNANNADSAFYYINKCLSTDSIDAIVQAMALLQRGQMGVSRGKFDTAAADINRAYLLFDSLNDIRGVMASTEEMAAIYLRQKNYEQAINIRLRTRHHFVRMKSPLTRYYLNLAMAYSSNEQYEQAQLYCDSTSEILKEMPDALREAKLLGTRGEISFGSGKIKNGLSQMLSAAKHSEAIGAFSTQKAFLHKFANAYVEILEKGGFIALPEHNIETKAELIPVFREIADHLESTKNRDYYSHRTFMMMALLYEGNEEYKTASRYWKLSTSMRDSLVKQEKSQATYELNTRTRELAAERSEAESRSKTYAARLESEKQRTVKYWAISIAGLLVALVLFVIYQLRKNRLYTAQLEEQKQLIEEQRDRLAELDDLKSNFFANISHELRTPLTLILGPITDIVKNRATNLPKEVSQLLQLSFRNGNKLQELVNEILDLGKLEVGELKVEESTVEMHQFTRRVFYTFESLAVLKSIQLKLDYQLDHPKAYSVDTNKLDKILSNLISNALKFTSNDGEVKLQVSSQGDQIAFVITDTGAGIHPDDLEKVFDRYYQSGHQKEGAGTGIGLSFAQQLAELMEGSLKVTSEFGKGSVFTLLLPLQHSDEEIAPVQQEEPVDPAISVIPENLGSDTSIMVVEDNPEMRQYIETTMRSHFHVVLANNGKEALAQLETKRFDLILSDLMMPEMDGMELLEAVKNNDDWKNLPFVMLTAKAADKDRLKALNIGLDDYLLKPFNTDELIVRISNLISNHRERNTEEPEENEDQQWLQKVQSLTEAQLTNRGFSVAVLAEELHMVERQVYRKMKALTGLTPNGFIQEMRLRQARNYLESGTYKTVKEVAASVGFDTYQYFTNIYVKRFGKKPVDYLR